MQNQTVNRPKYIKQSTRIRLDKASSVVKSCVLYRFTDSSSKVRKFSLCNLFNLYYRKQYGKKFNGILSANNSYASGLVVSLRLSGILIS